MLRAAPNHSNPRAPGMMAGTRAIVACALLLLLLATRRPVGAVFAPAEPLAFYAFVGANDSRSFVYPEAAPNSTSNYSMPSLTARARFGIAMSGGGMRAATTGLGYLRALHTMGVTDGARYLASNSGGSWLNAAFSFQQKEPITTFLGSYVPPAQLTAASLAQPAPPGSFEAAIAAANLLATGVAGAISDAAASLRRREDAAAGPGAWSNDVGRAFLEPFGLNDDASTFTTAGTAGPIHQQALAALAAPASGGPQVYVYRPYPPPAGGSNETAAGAGGNGSVYRPFPIMMGAILLPDSHLRFYAFEFTPSYVGMAPFFEDTTPPLGGGFTDPVGLNTPAPQPPPQLPQPMLAGFAATNVTGFDNGTLLSSGAAAAGSQPGGNASAVAFQAELLPVTSKPAYLVPLKVVAGISSSFITNGVQPTREFGRELTGTEQLSYWSPLAFKSSNVAFGDGGSADNLAVTPLLRRRVTKLVVLVAAVANVSSVTDAVDWAGYQWDVSALFGAAPANHSAYGKGGTITGIPVDLFNRKLHVFPTASYQELFDGLRATTAAGGPTHHAATYTVVTNPFQAITGGWQVEVLWVVNQQQTAWEAALPPETATLLQQGRAGPESGTRQRVGRRAPLAHDALGNALAEERNPAALGLESFPLIPTAKASYSPTLTRLLSQQACWQVASLRPHLARLLAGTNVTLADA